MRTNQDKGCTVNHFELMETYLKLVHHFRRVLNSCFAKPLSSLDQEIKDLEIQIEGLASKKELVR